MVAHILFYNYTPPVYLVFDVVLNKCKEKLRVLQAIEIILTLVANQHYYSDII